MAINTTGNNGSVVGVTGVHPDNIGKGIKWNDTTKQYEVDIVDLTPINNSISTLSNEIDGLKNRPDRDTIYDDTVLKNELTSLRALVNSMQNTETPNVKYFKIPLSVSTNVKYDNTSGFYLVTRYSVSYTINENINNIQAIECKGIITGTDPEVVATEIGLIINKINDTSISVRGGGGITTEGGSSSTERYNTGYGIIIVYLK